MAAEEHAGEVAGRVADLAVAARLDVAVLVEQQDVHRPLQVPAVVVAVRAHGDVAVAVAVEVADRGEAASEPVAGIEHGGQAAVDHRADLTQ